MVEKQLRRRGIGDPRVLSAMLAIPREEFVPPESRVMAYMDGPVPIGWGQTISQPYITALMAESLELNGSETVLEVGTGCGYHAAVLGALAARVISVEIIPVLADAARTNLRRVGRDRNVAVLQADGSMGHAAGAPYDAISVAAGAPDVPAALLEQLNDPGVLVIPVGEGENMSLLVITKNKDGSSTTQKSIPVRFVPLTGEHADKDRGKR